MEKLQVQTATRIGAYTTLLGSICMLSGAAIWATTGTNLDLALYENGMAGYLKGAFESQTMLITNLSLWIAGVILLGIGATMMTMLGEQNPVPVQLVRYNYWIAVPLAITSYIAWLAVVVRVASSRATVAVDIAEAIGWFGMRAEWVATVLILGCGPILITTAGRSIWIPSWLRVWSYITLLTGVITTIALYTGGLTTYGFFIVPVGIGWMIAASVVLFRRLGASRNLSLTS